MMDFLLSTLVSLVVIQLWTYILKNKNQSENKRLQLKIKIFAILFLGFTIYSILVHGFTKQIIIQCLGILFGGLIQVSLTWMFMNRSNEKIQQPTKIKEPKKNAGTWLKNRKYIYLMSALLVVLSLAFVVLSIKESKTTYILFTLFVSLLATIFLVVSYMMSKIQAVIFMCLGNDQEVYLNNEGEFLNKYTPLESLPTTLEEQFENFYNSKRIGTLILRNKGQFILYYLFTSEAYEDATIVDRVHVTECIKRVGQNSLLGIIYHLIQVAKKSEKSYSYIYMNAETKKAKAISL